VANGGEQLGGQCRGVLQGGVRADTTGRRHGVDGVAEQRDRACLPRGDVHTGPDPDREVRVLVGVCEELPEGRMPLGGRLDGAIPQAFRGEREQLVVRPAETLRGCEKGDHQVVRRAVWAGAEPHGCECCVRQAVLRRERCQPAIPTFPACNRAAVGAVMVSAGAAALSEGVLGNRLPCSVVSESCPSRCQASRGSYSLQL
jgi:hypothetical protein